MEFLLFCLIFVTGYLVAFKPHKQSIADKCLIGCIALSIFIWVVATWGMLIPAGNL